MRRVSGGLGFVSERVGVRRHAVAACIAGLVVLLAGCSLVKGQPELVEVDCIELDLLKPGYKVDKYIYSDGSIKREESAGFCD